MSPFTAPRADLLEPPRTAPPHPAAQWVPVLSLSPRHRPCILSHLLELADADRYLRFGHVATDSQIAHYVERLDFDRDEIFGVFDRRLNLVAMAHLAFDATVAPEPCAAEFGVSVLSRLRRRGLGAQLFGHAMLHARNRGVDTLVVHALSENTAMLRLAQQAGARIQRDGADSTAVLKLPPEDLSSQFEALMGERVAALDYGLKLHAQTLDALWDFLTLRIPGSRDAGGLPNTHSRGSDDSPQT